MWTEGEEVDLGGRFYNVRKLVNFPCPGKPRQTLSVTALRWEWEFLGVLEHMTARFFLAKEAGGAGRGKQARSQVKVIALGVNQPGFEPYSSITAESWAVHSGYQPLKLRISQL